MSVAKTLRVAIQEQSWSLAKQAYEELTGEPFEEVIEVEPPIQGKRGRGRPKKVKTVEIAQKPTKRNRKGSKAGVKALTAPRAVLANGRPNGFVDDGEMDKELRLSLNPGVKNLGGKVIEPRNAFQPIGVICSVCGKTEKISHKLAPVKLPGDSGDDDKTVYKCNRCITGRR